MKPMRCLSVTLAACYLILCEFPVQTIAQCPGQCGDVNGSATITTGDCLAIVDFLYHDGVLTTGFECADVDGYDLVNMQDVRDLSDRILFGLGSPVCATWHGPILPVPSGAFRLEHTSLVPANASAVALLFRLVTSQVVRTISLDVRVSVEGVALTLDSVGSAEDWTLMWFDIEPTGAPPGTLAAGFHEPAGFHAATTDLLTLYLHLEPTPSPRLITVDFVELPPIMDDANGTPRPVNYTMLLDAGDGAWIPQEPACRVWNTGDVNLDLDLTSSDVIAIVNYVFKGGFEPFPCPAAADVNCSGQVTSADIINFVNHVFKGGPAPCDVCALIPGTWGCNP